MIDNKKAIYIGLGIFAFLVIISSSKKVQLKEVPDNVPDTLAFDHSSLPIDLQPPSKLNENEPLPTINKPKNIVGINLMPRFDI